MNKHDLPHTRAGAAHDPADSDVGEFQKSIARLRLLSLILSWLSIALNLAFGVLYIVEGHNFIILALLVAAGALLGGSTSLAMRRDKLESRLRALERSLRVQLRSEARSDAVSHAAAANPPR